MPHPCLPVLLLTFLAPATADPGREPVRGTVLTRTGKPRPQAEVWLLSRPLPWTEQTGAADLVRTKTNAEGAFEALVLSGRPYTAWAVWKDASGVHVTGSAERVVPGHPVKLAENRVPFGRNVRLVGAGRWKHRGPLGLRLRPLIDPMWTRPISLDARGVGALPPVPMAKPRADLEVVDGDGSILMSVPMFLSSRSDEPADIEVGRPHEVEIVVLAKASGEPVAGATIRRRPWSSPDREYPGKPWALVGTTGTGGRCKIRVLGDAHPIEDTDRARESWLVSAGGYADVLAGVDAERFFAGNGYVSTPQKAVTIELERARPAGGRVLLPNGEPAAGVPVVVRSSWNLANRVSAKKRPPLYLPDRHVTTDGNGRFEISGFPLHVEAAAACVLLSRDACPALPDWLANDFVTSPVLLPFRQDAARARSFGTAALKDFAHVRVRYHPLAGHEGTSIHVRVHEKGAARPPFDMEPPRYSDGQGRIGLLLRKGRVYDLLAWGGDAGWAVHELRAAPGGVREITVALQPYVTVSGTVLTPERKPIKGAWVRYAGRGDEARRGVDADVAELNRAMLMAWCDDNGRFELRYVPSPGNPAELIAIARHTTHGPLFRSKLVPLGAEPRSGVELVVDIAEDWLKKGKTGR